MLPRVAWPISFTFALVVLIVELYLVVFLRLVTMPIAIGARYDPQWFWNLWTAGGVLPSGMVAPFLRVNVLVVLHLWAISRTMHPLREAVHRYSLVGIGAVLLAMQALLGLSSGFIRLR